MPGVLVLAPYLSSPMSVALGPHRALTSRAAQHRVKKTDLFRQTAVTVSSSITGTVTIDQSLHIAPALLKTLEMPSTLVADLFLGMRPKDAPARRPRAKNLHLEVENGGIDVVLAAASGRSNPDITGSQPALGNVVAVTHAHTYATTTTTQLQPFKTRLRPDERRAQQRRRLVTRSEQRGEQYRVSTASPLPLPADPIGRSPSPRMTATTSNRQRHPSSGGYSAADTLRWPLARHCRDSTRTRIITSAALRMPSLLLKRQPSLRLASTTRLPWLSHSSRERRYPLPRST
ncbi:hypothetical protein HYPSUDRAFT_197183 [Hypholoma sublateritium FD-334 SS-4]|uniref:Uncharacterized protein n=1 Tax=Hypholoma sublateritium (strain FD-334 SS-4) TaxID=945553 RepID=A0A0D2LKL8_HYPSF|nr:hypothetical protein HYPSUDRAFT_197183 [Hypholoma sublateritium FD-334 SS-4]